MIHLDPDTTLPPTFAPLRKAAEQAAAELAAATWRCVGIGAPPFDPTVAADNPWIDAQAYLLADLTRPESRLHWVFWLQQQQAEPGGGQVWWDIVSDADEAKALRVAILTVGAPP